MVALFLAQGFEEVEALTPLDYLRRAGAQVKTVGVNDKQVTGAHGITVTADLTAAEFCTDQLEMIVLPGGLPGTPHLEESPTVQQAIDYCAANGLFIGAICAAPSILGHKGLLRGKQAVCFPGFEPELNGAKISDQSVCRDDNFITAKGAGVSQQFGFALIAALFGPDQADQIARQVQWQ